MLKIELNNLTPIKYPGYYWDTTNKLLYSLKCGGELRILTKRKTSKWNTFKDKFYYALSVEGRTKNLPLYYFMNLKEEDKFLNIKKR